MNTHRLTPPTVRRISTSFPAILLLLPSSLLLHRTRLTARAFLHLIIHLHIQINLHLPIQTRHLPPRTLSGLISRLSPPTPSLPPGVIELAATRPAPPLLLPHSIAPSSLHAAHPCAKRVAVIQAPSCGPERVGSVAGVAGPEPWQWRVGGRSCVAC